ncbi:uncharacterized protein PAC_15075 [Phialocephala subalpina]|uniref:SET domain-containing protein n=1 Tax=Phialocephala subalpina TaxID=576137 RepID=A0A1L7XJE8_9HELO|nr:uncharacterized protein PAC_15075 [Phialocephala subalpina]
MASRTIFNPTKCFPPHPLLSRHLSTTTFSPARKICPLLEIVPIDGRGFGTIATQEIKPYTLIFSESPVGIAQYNPLDRYQEQVSIAAAHSAMSFGQKAGFDSLHEGVRPFSTKEMRIWNANCFMYDSVGSNSTSAVFLDMSRINHSCIPNAEYDANFSKNRMVLFSTQRIRAGEEVTINYGHEYMLKAAEERNAHLRYIYGFTCTCKACVDPSFKSLSDKRRRMLKEDFYCGMHDHSTAPDFSAKALGIDEPSSMKPGSLTQYIDAGFSDGINIFRPGTIQLMRRSLKLKFDEGLGGESFLSAAFTYASTALIIMHKRMRDRKSRLPVDPLTDLQRCMQLLLVSERLMREIKPREDKGMRKMREKKENVMGMWNSVILEEMTVAECRETLAKILSKEPDPFSGSSAYRA